MHEEYKNHSKGIPAYDSGRAYEEAHQKQAPASRKLMKKENFWRRSYGFWVLVAAFFGGLLLGYLSYSLFSALTVSLPPYLFDSATTDFSTVFLVQ